MILVSQVLLDLVDFKELLDFLDQMDLQVTHPQVHMVPKAFPGPKGTLGSLGMFIQDSKVLMGIRVIQEVLAIEDCLDLQKTELTGSPRVCQE